MTDGMHMGQDPEEAAYLERREQEQQPDVCPHGCRTPLECLRFDQGGSIPADCLLEQENPAHKK